MAKRRKKEEPPERDPSRIMFLSLNMILLAFFILLVALSQTDKKKEAELAIEVRKAFQSFGGAYLGLGRFLEERGVSQEQNPLETTQEIERFLGELAVFIQRSDQKRELSYDISSQGLTVHLTEAFTFAEQSDELLKESGVLLNSLQELILRTTNPVRIEGHTDNRDVRTARFRNKWELSAARAMAVFRVLTANGKIPASRFSVVGMADQKPLATNLTAGGRAKNRRVTITLVGRLRSIEDQ